MNETRVGKLKRLLIDELTDALENGVKATDDDGNLIKLTPSEKILNVVLATVKTFHSEVGEVVDLQADHLTDALSRFRDRPHSKRADA
jgi:hypothetical protein